MTLDRAIAGLFLVVCIAYGYTAFVPMQAELLPFERNMPFLPNVLPKWLSAVGIAVGLFVLVKPRATDGVGAGEIDLADFRRYEFGKAIALLALMVGYALLLRPLGFVAATALFLVIGGRILGERRHVRLAAVSLAAAAAIWYVVQQGLGIFLRPWPAMI